MSFVGTTRNYGLLALSLVGAACSGTSSRSYESQTAAIGPAVDSPAWTARLGGSGTDQISAVALDSAGNVLVSGSTASAFDSQTALGGGDAFVTKYSATGTKQWTRFVGTNQADAAYGVAVGSSDSVYVSGYVRASVDSQTFVGGTDFWISKYDSTGTRLWSRLLGSTGNDIANSVAVGSGAVYAAGVTASALPGNTAAGRTDIALAKYDESGNLAWAKSFGSAQDDSAAGVAVDSSGNAYVCGTAGAALPGATAVGAKDIFLSKYDASGTRLWTAQIGTAADDQGTGVAIGADGGIYVSGITAGGMSGAVVGSTDAVLVKFDSSGAVVWTRQLGSVALDEGLGVAADTASVYLTGRTQGQLPGANAGGLLNLFVAKYDFSGTVQTVREYSGGNSTGTAIGSGVAASAGRLIVVGANSANIFDGVATLGGIDGVVLDLCSGHASFACEFAGSCSTSNGGCTASQTCTPDVTGYVLCACNTGYTGSLSCSDVNECLVNNGGCDALTTCANTVGSRTCTACPGGYSGTGATGCVDVDECATNNGGCDPNALCINSAGSSSCGACKSGFTGTNATGCVDINECSPTSPCDSHTTCTNTPGSYTCGACPAGYTGTGATGCTDINECDSNPCDALTTCTNTSGSFTCSACPAGYTGTGKTGCTDIDECSAHACDVLTSCTNTAGSYSCSACPAGYTGTGATGCVDIDECSISHGGCDALTTCTNIGGSRICGACPDGYSGTGETGCIQGCSTHNGGCDALTTCSTNGSGAIVCGACPVGYTGTGATGCFNAPTNVTATAGDRSATISWTTPTSTGNSPLLGYIITCSPGSVETIVPSASATTATATGLTNGTSYTCTMRGASATQQGPESAATSAFTPVGAPGAPTGLSATRGNGQVTVSWAAPSSTGGSTITGYTVTSSPGTATASVNGSTTSATITGLTNGTTYTFAVYATNAKGDGAASSTVAATPATTPGAPTAVTGTPGNGQVAVSWTAPSVNGGSAITQSVVTASPGGATATVSGTGTSATVTGLTNGTSYTFTVVSSNAVGAGTASAASAAIVPRTVPGSPTSVVAAPGNANATVSWVAPASNGGSAITSYTITGTYAGGTVTKSSVTTITASVTGLTNGTSYTFAVKACNAAGCGTNSISSSAVVPFTVPSAPLSVTATAGDGQASISWTAPSSNGGNPILSYTVNGGTTPVTLTGTSTVVTGLTNGSVYNFSVAATTSAGTGTPGWASPVTPQSATCEAAGVCSTNNGGCASYQTCTFDGCHHQCGCPSGLVDNGSACTVIAPAWTARLGTSAAEQVNGTAIDSAGNVVVVGFTAGNLDGQTSTGGQDAFVTKYSATGTKAWTREFGSTQPDAANGVAIGSSDSIYVVGYAKATVDGQTFLGNQDVLLSKYDASGTRVWSRLLGTTANDVGTAVTVRNGAVYVVGYTALNFSGSTRGGGYDALVAKYDENGTQLWVKSFGTSADDFAQGVAVDSAGNAYLFGTTSGTMPGNSSSGGKDIFLSKYDSSGNRVFILQGGTASDDSGWAAAIGPDDNLYLAGTFQFSPGDLDAIIFKIDTHEDSPLWQAALSSTGTDEGLAIAVDSSGVYLAGRTTGQLPGANSYGDLNIFLARYDFEGNPLQVREYSGGNASGTTVGTGVAVAKGRVVVTGYTSAGTFDGVSGGGGNDGIVMDVCNGPNFACELSGSCSTSNGGCTATQTCTGASGSKVFCSCGSGYTGSVVCSDVNECRANNGGCDALTTCTNTPGAYVCGACPSGFSGTGASGCADIDECATNHGGCDALSTCFNTPGSSSCGPCPTGYSGTGDTSCVDVDECANNHGNCDPLATCTNTPGSRTCGACPTGYSGTGDTTCSDINECATNNGGCGSLTNCINSAGSFSCGTMVAAYPSIVTIGGESSTTLQIRMLSPSGSPQAGQSISIAVSGSDNVVAPASGITDSNGLFRAVLTSKHAETKVVTVSAGTQTLTTSVTFMNPTYCDSYAIGSITQSPAGGSADALTTADFDGDGNLDVAATNSASGFVSILLGKGDGTFETANTFSGGEDLPVITHGDLNGDGYVDLIVANAFFKTIRLLPGNGDGTFQGGMTLDLADTPQAAVVGDFNNDGADDVFIATTNNRGLLFASGSEGPSLVDAITNSTQLNTASRLATVDWNGDGWLDIVAGIAGGSTESQFVYTNNGDGTFSLEGSFSSGTSTIVAVGDVNGDGFADVSLGVSSGSVSYQAGTGTELSALRTVSTSGNALAASADINGDGKDDVVLAYSSGVGISFASGSGSLGTTTPVWNTTPAAVAIGDFDNDGRLDIVAVSSNIYVLRSTCTSGSGVDIL